MYQLTYRSHDLEELIHAITQDGASFISRQPETETYYHSHKYQLRLDEARDTSLNLIKNFQDYFEIIPVHFDNPTEIKKLLTELFGERVHLTKLVIRYHFHHILLEVHKFEKIGDLIYIQAENLSHCKEFARKYGLLKGHLITKTPADLFLKA